MKFQIRPVGKFVERSELPATRVCGQIEAEHYALRVDSAEFSIPILEQGADQYGKFAIVHEGQFAQQGGFVVRVSIDISSVDFEPGCCIELLRPRDKDMGDVIGASDNELMELALHPGEETIRAMSPGRRITQVLRRSRSSSRRRVRERLRVATHRGRPIPVIRDEKGRRLMHAGQSRSLPGDE